MARGFGRYGGGGFAEGFSSGFGLVNDFYDSRRKQALAEEELDMDRTYREGLIRDRDETRRITEQQNEVDQQIAKINAEAGLTRAETALLEQRNKEKLYDEDGNLKETPAQRAAREASEATANLRKEQIADIKKNQKKVEREELDARNINHLQNMHLYASKGDSAGLKAYVEQNIADIWNEDSRLGALAIFHPDATGWNAALAADVKKISEGALDDPDFRLSDESHAAITALLHKNRAQYIGTEVTDKNVNAPAGLRGGTITHSVVGDVRTTNKGIGGTTYTRVVMPDGSEHFYAAPITAGASVLSSENAAIPMEPGLSSMAATQGLMDFLNEDPVIERTVREAAIEEKFGSVEEYRDEVQKEYDLVMAALADSQAEGDMFAKDVEELEDYGFASNVTLGKLMSQKTMIKSQIEKTLLYGVSSATIKQKGDAYYEKLTTKLPNVTYEESAGGGRAAAQQGVALGSGRYVQGRTSRKTGTLDSLIKGGIKSLSKNQLLPLNLSINKAQDENFDNVLTGEELEDVKKYLQDNGLSNF